MTPDECKRYVQFIDDQELELTPPKKRGEAVRVNCASPLHTTQSRLIQCTQPRPTIRDLNGDGCSALLAARPAPTTVHVSRLTQAGRRGDAPGALVQFEYPNVQVHTGPALWLPLRRCGARSADGGTVGVDAASVPERGGGWREGWRSWSYDEFGD